MRRIGLTGGIATGKSTVARQFAQCGAYRYDADAAVHRLLRSPGPVLTFVAERFPEAMGDGAVDRRRLGATVFADTAALRALEAVIHPAVAREEQRLAITLARCGVELLVSEIPLLFEIGAEDRYDLTVTVSCPVFLQRRRAFRRSGMTEIKYQELLARQCTTLERRQKADAEIFTGLGPAVSMMQVKNVLRML